MYFFYGIVDMKKKISLRIINLTLIKFAFNKKIEALEPKSSWFQILNHVVLSDLNWPI